eukprot:TRINITY_DN36302_c0_g1_i1.p1 TRINITY_DN36302_c0_g1~~TRINITY_DN36302_c0_g1_i1.p1  ORF type:complete len:1049 (-),score=290.51 TRINITY_DN36302_c0_g1_i1:65-3211(-)
MPRRILVVSNRLPVTIHPEKSPPHDVEQSSGGLVSALRRVASTQEEELVWIGWPGCDVGGEEEQQRLAARLAEESTSIKLVPVWLDKKEVEDFYNGFSNSSLWPLLHWMTPYARFKKSWADSYRKVNQKFADVILATATREDLVWVQDYHLFMVPRMLRDGLDRLVPRGISRPEHLPPPIADHVDVEGEVKRPEGLSLDAAERSSSKEEQEEGSDTQVLDRMYSAEFVEPTGYTSATNSPTAKGPTVSFNFDPSSRQGEAMAATASAMGVGCGKADASSTDRAASFQRYKNAKEPVAEAQRNFLIAFFLHTPFPPHEVICALPQCEEIVEGLLGADLIGFHTYSYLRHFRSCVVRVCGLTPEIDYVDQGRWRTRLGVYPIGANWQDINEAMQTEVFQEHLKEYTKQYEGKSLVLSVERLDYSKGVPQKLAAIERYLELAFATDHEEEVLEERSSLLEDLRKRINENRPEQHSAAAQSLRRIGATFRSVLRQVTKPAHELDHKKTVFIFVAVPSRTSVQEYQQIEGEVHRSVSTINGRFSTPTHQPIVYIHRPVKMEELAALYARADCCLVTPLIDGMNLVAKEFVAAKNRDIPNVVPGTILVSELAGAAQELFDAIVVNPYDVNAVADAIAVSLDLIRGGHLEKDTRWEATRSMRDFVMKNDSVNWARTLLNDLMHPPGEKEASKAEASPLSQKQAFHFSREKKGNKIIVISCDDVFVESGDGGEVTKTAGGQPLAANKLSEETQALLAGLSARQDLLVTVVSKRSKEVLEEQFAGFPNFAFFAEGGYLKKERRFAGTVEPAQALATGTSAASSPASGPRAAPQGDWHVFNPHADTDWMDKVMPIVELFTRCTPGAQISKTESSLFWHYSECNDEYGQFKANELSHHLSLSLGNMPCQIRQDRAAGVVEVSSSLQIKRSLIVKQACLEALADGGQLVQALVVGGPDASEEDLFVEELRDSYTVKVGLQETHARFCVSDASEVREFLRSIVEERLPAALKSMMTLAREDSGAFKSCQAPVGQSTSFARTANDESDDDPLEGIAEFEEGG